MPMEVASARQMGINTVAVAVFDEISVRKVMMAVKIDMIVKAVVFLRASSSEELISTERPDTCMVDFVRKMHLVALLERPQPMRSHRRAT